MNNERSNSERVLSGAGILMTVFGALETVLFLVYVGVLVYVSKKAGNVFSAAEALLSGALFAVFFVGVLLIYVRFLYLDLIVGYYLLELGFSLRRDISAAKFFPCSFDSFLV